MGHPFLLWADEFAVPHILLVPTFAQKTGGCGPPSCALDVGVWSGMAEQAQHGYELTFVMESVGNNVQKNVGGAARWTDPAFWIALQR